MRNRAETLDLGFEVADLLMLPVKNVTPERIPGYTVGEADGLGGGEEHFRHHNFGRFDMVAANLIHPEGDRLVLAGILALDDQHRNTVDEKDHVFARAVVAVMKVKLFRYLINVAVFFTPPLAVGVIDQSQIQLPIVFGAEIFALVSQVGKKLSVAGNVCVEPPELADQGAFSLFVFWIKSQDLSVKQIVEVKRRQPSAVFGRSTVRIETATPLRLLSRHIRPADLLRIGENS